MITLIAYLTKILFREHVFLKDQYSTNDGKISGSTFVEKHKKFSCLEYLMWI